MDNMVGYWPMSEGVGTVISDQSQYRNNGSVTSPVWNTGIINSTLNFSTDNSYVTVPANSSFDPSDNLTMMAWIKTSDVSSTQQVITEAYGWCCHIDKNIRIMNGRIYFYARAVGGWPGFAYSKADLVADKWQHIAVVAREGQLPNFYINGVLSNDSASTQTYSKVGKHAGGSVTIGAEPLCGGGAYCFKFQGNIDEVGVYSEALTFSQIWNYYVQTAPKFNLTFKK
jgi:hypothetical protein